MDQIPDPLIGVIPQVVCIVLIMIISALLSAAEKAVDSLNKNEIRGLAEDGHVKAKKLIKILDRQSDFMASSTALVIFFDMLVAILVFQMLSARCPNFFTGIHPDFAGIITIVVFVLITALVFTVFCVIFPRQIAIKHPEGVGMKLAGFYLIFATLCKPFLLLDYGIATLLLIITRQGKPVREEEFSEEEVMSMLEAGQESGALKEEGKKMIDSIFAFDDKLAFEIMTPRTDVFAIDIDSSSDEYVDKLMEMRYSRIPVYEEDIDNILGILNIKDYLIQAREHGFENVDLKEILRQAFFVPDTKNIDSLFLELQRTKQHIAILIDEYGGFSGIVTMEDIIEEIVGDIDDEYDEEEPNIEKINDNTFYLDGFMDIDDVNEETGANLSSENNETVGGIIMEELGEIPDDGSGPFVVEYENYVFTVESIKDRRIERIKMEILPPLENKEDESQGDAK